ncbi:extracellular solute-binding protein [Myxococcus sp. K15C18031901]|uniref:extracellular solute-binding protein n=1 Tax=Myxococcus dinghuensis TaxID=2906761 RepID=UPI0020A74A1B|nr:extracellular solute-binding protein [Myxococcus dinghuensis]MCP3100351.1 extracellular solute-binding protein [Myxococcus dinghuensis]
MATCLQAGAALAEDPATLAVWHALGGMPEVAFGNAAQRHESQTGNTVVVSQFDDEAQLRDALRVAVASGNAPDVVVMNHTLAPEFRDAGALQAYCLPGERPECEGGDPPRWCASASNGRYGSPYGTFASTMIPDFPMDASRCLEEGCGECVTEGARPAYCDSVSRGFSRRARAPAASF